MNTKTLAAFALTLACAAAMMAQSAVRGKTATPRRPPGPCDIYAAAGDPCVAAHSTTRALYAAYAGPLYRVLRQSDGKALDIGVEPGGYADAAAQDKFCANTYCWISTIYDQSPRHNNLTQAPRGGFSGPAMGGFDNLPLAAMAPVTVMGHKVYGVFIEPGMGLRDDDPSGTAVDDQAEGQYWVISGRHFNGGCCFDYGNVEIDSRDDDNGTMEAAYFGDNAGPWFHGSGAGPWIMTDQENNLVGCVNPDGSKICKDLPSIAWPFVTAIAKGEPHHWTSMGGDAQHGPLAVMFSGPRVNFTYDPMRKQGAIVLGNGGDNSNSSQGTFYEGAMTAAGAFPSDTTDQLVQANIVAARYRAPMLQLAPAASAAAPPGLQTFTPGSSQRTTLTFTNATDAPAADVRLSLAMPGGQAGPAQTIAGPVAPGASVAATFLVTSGLKAFNGDLRGTASWKHPADGALRTATTAEKVRNVPPVRIRGFRIGANPPANATNAYIELDNAGDHSVNLSHWTLTVRPARQAIFSAVEIPSGTTLKAHGVYRFGLANSGLAVAARAGDAAIHVRSTAGMAVGDTVTIGAGAETETRRIAGLGTAAGDATTVWQSLPDGPVITISPGATNLPVTSVQGFVTGEKIALGYGAASPAVARARERYEVVTVTGVGKPGTQAYLAAEAPAGATNIKVTSVRNISAGDKIRLDIASRGHGIETVTVTRVGTPAARTALAAAAAAGAANIKVNSVRGFTVGDRMTIGPPADSETVTITSVGDRGADGSGIGFTPGLTHAFPRSTRITAPGTGLDLAAPLRFNHAGNLPFSDRGTGISFEPATAFAHSSNEPVLPLGSGLTLDRPLTRGHTINAVVRDAAVTTAGYQGAHAPDQWFGGPELATRETRFGGRTYLLRAGSMVLRNAQGLVVDSLNYGALVDPWAAAGYQGTSGPNARGCFAPAPRTAASVVRAPAGADTGSNCADFRPPPIADAGSGNR